MTDCGSNMYGGFNGSECQSCPMNTGNDGGFAISSCECIAGYTATPDGTCVCKSLKAMLYFAYNHPCI